MKKQIKTTWEMQDYFRKKAKLTINSRLKQYFSILQKSVEGLNDVPANSSIISTSILHAFGTLNKSEKIRYLIENIDYILKVKDNKIQRRSSINSNIEEVFDHSKSIQTTCQIGNSKLFSCFRIINFFTLDKNKRLITVQNKKTQKKQYDLKNYLMHRSKKKNQIILEKADNQRDIVIQNDSIRFSFSSNIADKIYDETWNCIMSYRNQQLLFFLIPNKSENHRENSGRVFLNNNNFKELMKYKEKIIQEAKMRGQKWATLYQKKKRTGDSIVILQSRVNDKLIKLQAIYQKPAKKLKEQFLLQMDEPEGKCPHVVDSYILEEYKQIYQAIYQKLNFHGRNFQLIFIKDSYPTNNKLNNSTQGEDILFIKGVNNIVVINFLEFMLVTVTSISDKVSKITFYCSFKINQIITSKLIKIYLLGLINETSSSLDQKNAVQSIETQHKLHSHEALMEQIDNEQGCSLAPSQRQIFFDFGESESHQDFYSIRSDSFISLHEDIDKQKTNTDKTTAITPYIKSNNTIPSEKYIYLTEPINNYDIKGNLMTEHFLFSEWKRKPKGGVICVNQERVNAQKKVFKQVISSMGSQILKGGNILNVSLPVSIFKKESHIQMIAKDFIYAPLLLENRGQVLQKMKYTVLFALSFGLTGISLQKPFFTFLGETVQYWVGGCPVYVQQISRFPPITSYLFIGRGFRVYGQVDPKISFGINGVKGYSDVPVIIQFDDGTSFELIFGRIVVSGLFFGDRQFNFNDKMYVYDRKNNLFAETTYGPRQTSVFGKNQQPQDFYYGKIYQVKPQYRQIFEKRIPREYPHKKNIVKQVSTFEGTWCGKAYFDNDLYYDFQNELPCQLIRQKHVLPSDSSFRPQLTKLMEGDLEQSQRLKIIAEESQRKDRKLRELHNKKS